MSEKEVELAKSWFVLSQTLMLLAGFLFAAGGAVWGSSINTMDTEINLFNTMWAHSNDVNNSVVSQEMFK